VVSFSYRHRPGLSFINTFERDELDLIDDLIHENSHHHLNLLLRKYVMHRRDRNQEIFYSPWRRSLRPLRGILHATFTFTMGAILFERLSAWGARGKGQGASGKATLTNQQILRARFRCLEEVESVRYSIKDLEQARKLGWLTPAGWGLVNSLKREIDKVEKRIAPFEAVVLRSKYGADLKWHRKELAKARKTYGPFLVKRDGS
jgi:HEXXH motif-containing protein